MTTTVQKGRGKPTHELKDLTVFEVSLVDRPAIERPFLIVKNSETQMPTGTPLQEAPDGTLSTPAAKATFEAERKKKIQQTLTTAAKKLTELSTSIADADDEAGFMKRVASVVAPLSGTGSSGENSSGGDTANKEANPIDPVQTPAITTPATAVAPQKTAEEPTNPASATGQVSETLTALDASLQDALNSTSPDVVANKQRDARLDKLHGQLASLTKATHTLTAVVQKTSRGSRPSSQAAPTGENKHVEKTQTQSVWRLDMNSPNPDPDEQFV